MTVSPRQIVARHLKAQHDAEIERLMDHWADVFLDTMASNTRIDEKAATQVLRTQGISADTINSLDDGKHAGSGVVRALGGLIRKGLWYTLIRPFIVLGKTMKSSAFRVEVKREFKKALSHDIRATKHMFSVMSRMLEGEAVSEPEKKAAKKRFVNLMVKAVLIAAAGSTMGGGLFSGGVWAILSKMMVPLQEILIILLNKPFQAAARKLMTTAV